MGTRTSTGRGRRGALIVGLAVLLPLAAVVFLGSSVLGADHTIAIQNRAYSPASITVHVDELITWQNKDDVEHTVTSGGVFDFRIPAGGSWAVSFGKAGAYEYGCTIHTEMKGTLTVLAAGAQAPAPSAAEPSSAPQVAGATSGPQITGAPTDALGFGGGTSSGNLAATLAAIVGAAAVAFGLAIRRMTQVR